MVSRDLEKFLKQHNERNEVKEEDRTLNCNT